MPQRMAPSTTSKKSNSVSNRVQPSRLPRLCVAVQGATNSDLLARAERAARNAGLVELRLDGLKNPSSILPGLRDLVRSFSGVSFLATCRGTAGGGQYGGSAESEWNILCQAAEAGCGLVDLSVQVAAKLKPAQIEALRAVSTLVLSWHDFKGVPDLAKPFAAMRRIPADVYKLVPTATDFADNLKLLQFVEEHSAEYPLVAFCMGEAGIPSRLLSLRAGAVFTFASLPGEQGTASGQIDSETMRDLYRVDDLGRATRLYGVLGYPLGHSLSPLMQKAALRRAGVNGLYLPLSSQRPEPVVEAAESLPLHGFSVTIPHKSAILPLLHNIDDLARKVGAVNTVVRSQGRLYGYNTDVTGIVIPLSALISLRKARVLVLGAGGAARAAVFGLAAQGATVSLFNRTKSHGKKLAEAAGAELIARRTDLRKRDFDVILNATPVGQYPNVDASPLEPQEIRARILFDLVYNPMETALVRMARQAGLRIIPGVEMFIHQGARQFELWTAKPAPVDEMRNVVMNFLSAREKSRL